MIAIAGAGAFGTALAVALGREGRPVALWARDVAGMAQTRRNDRYLPGVGLPDSVTISANRDVFSAADTILLAIPMQALAGFLQTQPQVLQGKTLVACCKGIDLTTLEGPSAVIRAHCPGSAIAVLT